MGFMSNPSSDGGDFKIFLSYNAKAGRWYTKEDKPEAEQYEVTNMTAMFDFENIRTGWFLFAAGVAPVKNFDPSLTQVAAKPGEGFKRGFEIDVLSEKNFGGMREFSSTAGIVIESMNTLYDLWEAGKGANPGKVPVVKCVSVKPITNKHGTNYQPVFDIVQWADRPSEFGASGGSVAEKPVEKQAASKHVDPPKQAAASDDDVDAVEF